MMASSRCLGGRRVRPSLEASIGCGIKRVWTGTADSGDIKALRRAYGMGERGEEVFTPHFSLLLLEHCVFMPHGGLRLRKYSQSS